MMDNASDLSEISELEFYSATSQDSDDVDITSYSSFDDTTLNYSAGNTANRARDLSPDYFLKNCENYKYPLSNPSCHTTGDVLSSQVFEGWDSPVEADDIKQRFEKCIQFFSELSNKSNRNCNSQENVSYNLRKWAPLDQSCGGNPNVIKQLASIDEKTVTSPQTNQTDISTQTKDYLNNYPCQGKTNDVYDTDQVSFDDFMETQIQKIQFLAANRCEKPQLKIVNDGDNSPDVVSATATTVISAKNGTFNCRKTHDSTAQSNDPRICSWLASSKSIYLGLGSCTDELSNILSEKGHAVINLSTTCLITKDNSRKTAPVIENISSCVCKSSIVEKSIYSVYSVPQLTHISNSSDSSTSSEDSILGKSKIFVATPVTMTSVLTTISNNSNVVKEYHYKKPNLDSVSPELCRDHMKLPIPPSSVSDKFNNHSKILQSIFFRTSTPLHESKCKSSVAPNLNGFLTSSFTPSKSIRELQLDSFCDQSTSRSLDNRKSRISRFPLTSNDRTDKRIFLSLYNLTCSDLFSVARITNITNPTNVFFSNSKSHGSLKETDIDSGLERCPEIYKETDLDKYSSLIRQTKYRTSSLNNLYYSKPDQSLMICADLDENILNKCISSRSVSKSSRSLYIRLCDNAKTSVQMRVAKSITKLNIPCWLSSVEFIQQDHKTSNRLSNVQTPEIKPKPKPKPKPKLTGIAKTLQNKSAIKRPGPTKEKLNVSLPSKKYETNEHKLQPIHHSKARDVLINSMVPTLNCDTKSVSVQRDVQAKLNGLYASFLSQYRDLATSFNQMREAPMYASKVYSKFCSRKSCSQLIIKSNSQCTFCGECCAIYCSVKCRSDDFFLHSSICFQDLLKQWLNNLIDNVFIKQISILSEIYHIGLQHFGVGFIIWKIVKSHSHKFSTEFLKYALPFEARKMQIILDEEKLKKVKCLFTISLNSESKSNPIFVSKYLLCGNGHMQLLNEDHQSPCTNDLRQSVNLNREERQNIFNAIDTLLHNFSINVRETYPAFYFRLVEYVAKGCSFAPHNFVAKHPSSGLKMKIVIAPDQMPVQIAID